MTEQSFSVVEFVYDNVELGGICLWGTWAFTRQYHSINPQYLYFIHLTSTLNRGADKSLARPGRKQATETENFEFHISYLYS